MGVWGGGDVRGRRDRLEKVSLPTQPLAAPRVGGWSASAAGGCGERAGHRHPAAGTRRSAAPPRPAPRSSPPARRLAPAAETHSPQELDLVLASFSPFGHDSRGVGGAQASGASASPGSRSACAGCCCALSPPLLPPPPAPGSASAAPS